MHIEKYTTSAVSGLAFHCERGGKEHTNKNIDPEKTKLNMNPKTFEIDGERYAISKSNLDRMKTEHEKNTGRALRKDSPTVCSIVVTLPEQYKNLSQDKKNEFFLTAFWGLYKKFGVKRKSDHASNLLWATVHYDETTPHMHFAFVPWDKKKDKITYKTIVNRDVYRTLHQDLDKYLSEHLEYYKGGILLPPEKQRTRAYNIKDAQKINEKFNEREFLCTMKEKDLNTRENELNSKIKGWEDDRPRRDGIREEVMKKKEELEELEEQVKNTQNLLKVEKDSLWKIQNQKQHSLTR